MSIKEAIIEKLNLPPENGYIKYREDDEYFYIDIGRNDEIEAFWNESFVRIKALEDKFNQKLLDILGEVQAEEKKSLEEKNLFLMPTISNTPSKSILTKGGRNKRLTPSSSSVNKVILRGAKHGSGNKEVNSSLKANKKLFDGNSTPAKLANACSSYAIQVQMTPSSFKTKSFRPQNAELGKEEKLIASEEKRKKASAKKRNLLKTRAQILKEEREYRMEKIRKNKLALEQQAKEAAAATKTPIVSEASTGNGPKRYQLRRKVLDKVSSNNKTGPQTRAAKAKAQAAAEASTRKDTEGDSSRSSFNSTRPKRCAAKKVSGKKSSKKLAPSKMVVGKVAKEAGKTPESENENPISFSPIFSENHPKKGINQRLSQSFTSAASADNINDGNHTFAVPQGVPPSKTASTTPGPHCSTFQNTKGMMTPVVDNKSAHSFSQYEMTPPPKTPSYLIDNYDISQYIDSDDEEAQEAAQEKAGQKRIPKWAEGRLFLRALTRQFNQSSEVLAVQAAKIFPAVRLPVPLKEMGLPVKEQYATRSSSVNWKTAAEIKGQLKDVDASSKE